MATHLASQKNRVNHTQRGNPFLPTYGRIKFISATPLSSKRKNPTPRSRKQPQYQPWPNNSNENQHNSIRTNSRSTTKIQHTTSLGNTYIVITAIINHTKIEIINTRIKKTNKIKTKKIWMKLKVRKEQKTRINKGCNFIDYQFHLGQRKGHLLCLEFRNTGSEAEKRGRRRDRRRIKSVAVNEPQTALSYGFFLLRFAVVYFWSFGRTEPSSIHAFVTV